LTCQITAIMKIRKTSILVALFLLAPLALFAQQAPAADPFAQAMVKLKSGTPAERRQGVDFLGQSSDPKAGTALIGALSDASSAVRAAAMHALGVMRYAPAGEAIAALLDENAGTELLRGGISALGLLRSTAAVSVIVSGLGHQDRAVRIEAARALGEIGDKSSAPELGKHLAGGEDAAVRVECALALAKMGINDGLPAAREFLASPDLSLKGPALNVLVTARDAGSLELIESLYAAETDPASKAALDFARQSLTFIKEEQQRK